MRSRLKNYSWVLILVITLTGFPFQTLIVPCVIQSMARSSEYLNTTHHLRWRISHMARIGWEKYRVKQELCLQEECFYLFSGLYCYVVVNAMPKKEALKIYVRAWQGPSAHISTAHNNRCTYLCHELWEQRCETNVKWNHKKISSGGVTSVISQSFM